MRATKWGEPAGEPGKADPHIYVRFLPSNSILFVAHSLPEAKMWCIENNCARVNYESQGGVDMRADVAIDISADILRERAR